MAFQVSKGHSCRSAIRCEKRHRTGVGYGRREESRYRRYDLHILDESYIDARLVELTSERPADELFTCNGDSAYPQMQ